jgi:hypothetical protein
MAVGAPARDPVDHHLAAPQAPGTTSAPINPAEGQAIGEQAGAVDRQMRLGGLEAGHAHHQGQRAIELDRFAVIAGRLQVIGPRLPRPLLQLRRTHQQRVGPTVGIVDGQAIAPGAQPLPAWTGQRGCASLAGNRRGRDPMMAR